LELQRRDEDKVIDKDRISRIERIETGLTCFFLNISAVLDDSMHGSTVADENADDKPAKELLKELENSTKRLRKTGINLTSNLYTRLIRPRTAIPGRPQIP
jgi:hypothetical protein